MHEPRAAMKSSVSTRRRVSTGAPEPIDVIGEVGIISDAVAKFAMRALQKDVSLRFCV